MFSVKFKQNLERNRQAILKRNPLREGKRRSFDLSLRNKRQQKASRGAPRAINLRGKGPHNKTGYDKEHPKFDVIRRDSDDRRNEANARLNAAIRIPCQKWPA